MEHLPKNYNFATIHLVQHVNKMKINFYLGVIMSPRLYFYLGLLLFISFYVLLNYKKLNKTYKLLGLVIIISMLSEIIARYLSYAIANSYPPYHFLVPFLVFIHTQLYLSVLKATKKMRSFFNFIMVVLILFSIINTIYFQNMTELPTRSYNLLSLMIVFYSLLMSKQMLITPLKSSLWKHSFFWVNMGNFIFYTLTLFIMIILPYLIKSFKLNQEWIYGVLYFLNIFLYSFYFLALHFHLQYKDNGI